MKSWRIFFYGFLITGLFTVVKICKRTIHDFHFRTKSSSLNDHRSDRERDINDAISTRINGSRKPMMIRRLSRREVHPPNVVAPWTTLGKLKGKVEPRSFVFAETKKLDSEYGVPQIGIDEIEGEQIKKEALRRLCAKSKKFSQNVHPAPRCNQNLELLRCVTCSERDGVWYTAVSETGSVFGKIFNQTSLHFPNFNDGPFLYQHLDIAVPIAGQDEKLQRFVAKLGHSIKKFRSGMFGAKITIRLLVSRFPFDSPLIGTAELEEFRLHLSEIACLSDVADDVQFVEVTESPKFNRAKAVNALHREAYHSDNNAMAMIDVDLSIESKFLRNALTYPFPNGMLLVARCTWYSLYMKA